MADLERGWQEDELFNECPRVCEHGGYPSACEMLDGIRGGKGGGMQFVVIDGNFCSMLQTERVMTYTPMPEGVHSSAFNQMSQ